MTSEGLRAFELTALDFVDIVIAAVHRGRAPLAPEAVRDLIAVATSPAGSLWRTAHSGPGLASPYDSWTRPARPAVSVDGEPQSELLSSWLRLEKILSDAFSKNMQHRAMAHARPLGPMRFASGSCPQGKDTFMPLLRKFRQRVVTAGAVGVLAASAGLVATAPTAAAATTAPAGALSGVFIYANPNYSIPVYPGGAPSQIANLTGPAKDSVSSIGNSTDLHLCFYEHANYGGLEFRIGPGEWWATIPGWINDKISSYRPC
ncbi:hypothetical protein [Streptomyces sp. NPDC090025]|uniref:hypothetical protein n=1 Tax=Streptomyces sp. NPDC090025 TaxID=3365922 RepID=UPI0038342E12